MKTKNILGRLGIEYNENDKQEMEIIFLAAFFAIDIGCLLGLIIYGIISKL